MDEQKEMNHMRELVELNEWQDCLWHAMKYVGLNGKDEDKERVGNLLPRCYLSLPILLSSNGIFIKNFRYLGFPISCNGKFWRNALEQVKEKISRCW